MKNRLEMIAGHTKPTNKGIKSMPALLQYNKDTSGKFRVGYKEFTTKLQNECSVFYPAKDDKSGTFGVPFFTY